MRERRRREAGYKPALQTSESERRLGVGFVGVNTLERNAGYKPALQQEKKL
jgi:hypothetical protein